MNVFVAEQEIVKARLLSSPYFADIPIATEAKGTITEDVAQAIAASGLTENAGGKTGIAVVLRTPTFSNSDPRATGLSLVLEPKVSIYENVTINQDPVNGIGKAALDVVQACIFLLHAYAPHRGPGKHAVLDGDSEESESGVVAYHLSLAIPGFVGGLPT